MANSKENDKKAKIIPPPYDLNAKMDACIDLTVYRVVKSSFAGTFTGLLLFRSPVIRWASVAFGAGIGIGSAYIESSYIFAESSSNFSAAKCPALNGSAADCKLSKVSAAASSTPTQGQM